MTKFIDLSHTIHHDLLTYKGLPRPVIEDHMARDASEKNYTPGTTFQIGKISMVANTGTYIDAPFHRYEDGKDLAGFELGQVANLDGVCVATQATAVGPEHLPQNGLEGKALLIATRWHKHWKTDHYTSGQHPYLTKEAAEHLAGQKVGLVGIDSYNIDSIADGSRPVHTALLRDDIPIVEHMADLTLLVGRTFRFFAVPPKVQGMGSFPIRAFAIVS
ncbi:MAG: cyclase family protein [Candidatus Eisenbacteria bacterium]|uniref:Cyclase family protein n=1 Tax=Eiseniibacteriota bacterium TaxID=2212470 RepID=A0A7Y2E564_UNCEI|nr:cyclase family protein [Candidatus Eisenbacteria bacterium]